MTFSPMQGMSRLDRTTPTCHSTSSSERLRRWGVNETLMHTYDITRGLG